MTKRENPQQLAQIASLVGGLLCVVMIVGGWFADADFVRQFLGILLGAVVGGAIGVFGPGAAIALTRLLGTPIRIIIALIALGLLVWAVVTAFTGGNVGVVISIAAAALMIGAWIPMSKLGLDERVRSERGAAGSSFH